VKSFRITVAPHFTCIVKETKVIRPYNRKLGKDVHTPGVTPPKCIQCHVPSMKGVHTASHYPTRSGVYTVNNNWSLRDVCV